MDDGEMVQQGMKAATSTRMGTEWSVPSGYAASAGRTKASSPHVLHQPDGNQLQNETGEPELAWDGCAEK